MVHEQRFYGDIEKLRSPKRIAVLDIERVVGICEQAFTPKIVLDEGTGTGLFAEGFTARGQKVIGVDVKPIMLQEAMKQVPEAYFQLAQMENLPFSDRSFDMAFLGLVLHEADDPGKALQEAARVTRKGIAVLEWPYIEQVHGPSLGTRISPEQMMVMSHAAGLQMIQRSRLKELELTLLTHKSPKQKNRVEKE